MRKDIQEQIDELIKTLPSGVTILGETLYDEAYRFVTYKKKCDYMCLVQHRILFIKTATKIISKPYFEVIYKTKWELHPDSLKELEEIQ